MLGLDRGVWKRAGRTYWAAARAYPLSCLFTIIESAGLPLLVIGLENHDHVMSVIGAVLAGLWVLDMAILTPIRRARHDRKRRDAKRRDAKRRDPS